MFFSEHIMLSFEGIAVINNMSCEWLKTSIAENIKIINGKLLVSCLDYFISSNIIFKNLEGFFSGKNFVNYTNINESWKD